ncbi:MAG: AMP-binding protein, partial [Rhodobacteraceae bacterium]|nr:AMP-binding protein [Paracoccaceae bacterium]
MAMDDQGPQMRAIPAGWDKAHVTPEGYRTRYADSVNDPDGFWGREGKRLDWIKPYSRVKNTCFDFGRVDIRWYEDGVLNVSVNCIDRHLAKRGDQTAILWEPDDPKAPARHITYRELADKVNRMANVLLSQGVMRGDRVVIYM